MRTINHFVSGGIAAPARFGDVFNPNTGEVQARVGLGYSVDLDHAVAAAQRAEYDAVRFGIIR